MARRCDTRAGAVLAALIAIAAAWSTSVASAQTQDPPDEPPLSRTLTLQAYQAQADGALPAFNSQILTAGVGPDWFGADLIRRVATAVQDTPAPDDVVQDGFLTEARDSSDTKFIKLDSFRGRVRYANRTRSFDWSTSPHTAIPASLAAAVGTSVLDGLQIPSDERIGMTVDTVGGMDYDPSSGEKPSYERERLVTVRRIFNGYPVVGSIARIAVSNVGEPARLLVIWPKFQMPTGLQLRTRAAVVDDIANRINDSEFGAAVELKIGIGYARAGLSYLPVAMAHFSDPQSGEVVIVPLVTLPADQDFDGVPDPTDNCIEDANPLQEDHDNDGVGDLCDNCRRRFNPGQADSDADGIGDACDCGEQPHDVDNDGDVDVGDFSVFQVCFNGPNRPYASAGDPQVCACLDIDGDNDVDLSDFGEFLACFNGPNRPAACE